ncbi:hypothetical protein ACFWUP_02750 [Nocardia sp. NPDC058658]|uniref:poly(ethylene terephthalate) hydrolase family protein n=1 Tax=Nocardia sp. NPDC058658 TaxID=3346580 RepID=UPI00364D10CC
MHIRRIVIAAVAAVALIGGSVSLQAGASPVAGSGDSGSAGSGSAAPTSAENAPIEEDAPELDGPGSTAEVTVEKTTTTTFYRPSTLSNAKYPVVAWGNGTGAKVSFYDGLLRNLAKAGFIVAAANTTQSNLDGGKKVLDGARTLIAANDQADSVYFGKIDTTKIAISGHSQGGLAAVNSGSNEIVSTVLAIQPGPGNQQDELRVPTLYLAGEKDNIVRPGWVLDQYKRTTQVPAWFAELGGEGHLDVGKADNGFHPLIINWLKYQLYGDAAAKNVFVGPQWSLSTDTAYTKVLRNDKASALN